MGGRRGEGARGSRISPVETALGLRRREFAAREGHGLEDLFVLESGLGVRSFGFLADAGSLLASGRNGPRLDHCNPACVNFTATLLPKEQK